MSVRCGYCHDSHLSVDTVILCSQGLVSPCGYQFATGRYNEDGDLVIESCQAPAYDTPRGGECEFGHSYVDMETRQREGWDYFDADDLGAAREHGVLVFTGPDGEMQPW